MSERLRNITLDQLAQKHSETVSSALQIYVLEGWQLLLMLAQNYTDLQDESAVLPRAKWYSACHVGVWRSKQFNQFLLEQRIPLATIKRPKGDQNSGGHDYFSLAFLIASGRIRDGAIVPENFDVGFRNLVIFVSAEEVLAERVQMLFISCIQVVQGKNPGEQLNRFRVFIVADDETTFSEKLRTMNTLLNQGKNASEISSLLNMTYNELQGSLEYDLRFGSEN
jgi:hypothetical protein